MRERLMTVVAALLLLVPAFVSCKETKEKEPDDPADIAWVEGSYSGTLGYSVMGYPADNLAGDYTLQIAKDADGGVSVTLPECSFTYPGSQAGAYTIPAMTVSDVSVRNSGGVYTLAKNDFSVTLDGVTYTGSIAGTVAGKDAKMEYSMQPGRMPMVINFTFQGTSK